uniref:Uncharacterized protein n=1 Tax=Cucumis melo TaxID=3656 RepID=A0A9I9D5S8_CUCME
MASVSHTVTRGVVANTQKIRHKTPACSSCPASEGCFGLGDGVSVKERKRWRNGWRTKISTGKGQSTF